MVWRRVALSCIVMGVLVLFTGCPAGSKITVADIDFVWCPDGEFYMGSTDGNSNELPVHHVTISKGFWISSEEVSQEQWMAIMGDNPSDMTGDPRAPVENVSWNDVQTYITALNDAHPLRTFRLPTEAEWEYACRADTSTAYFFGTDSSALTKYAWYSSNDGNKTHLVGQKEANDWGLYDVYGNVGEWVNDWYDDYPEEGAAETDPQGPETGSTHVFRGGTWSDDAATCTSSHRSSAGADKRSSKIGFRLVME